MGGSRHAHLVPTAFQAWQTGSCALSSMNVSSSRSTAARQWLQAFLWLLQKQSRHERCVARGAGRLIFHCSSDVVPLSSFSCWIGIKGN